MCDQARVSIATPDQGLSPRFSETKSRLSTLGETQSQQMKCMLNDAFITHQYMHACIRFTDKQIHA